MKPIRAYNMSCEEFEQLLGRATNNNVNLGVTGLSWFYTVSSETCDYEDDESIVKAIEDYLKVKISNIIIDIFKDENGVVIILDDKQ